MLEFLGLCIQNFLKCLKYIFTRQIKFSNVLEQAASISYDSLVISLTIAFIAAVVIAIQVSKQFLMTGAETYIGGTIAIVMIREIAPGFVALAIGARAGTAIAAEIANMQVTSQVDAIKTLKVDPVGYYFICAAVQLFYTLYYYAVRARTVYFGAHRVQKSRKIHDLGFGRAVVQKCPAFGKHGGKHNVFCCAYTRKIKVNAAAV